jgi:hypothetical protein
MSITSTFYIVESEVVIKVSATIFVYMLFLP